MGKLGKAAGLAGKLAKKGLDKADEKLAERREARTETDALAGEAAQLSPHHFTQEVVGESHYQKALEKSVGRNRDHDGSYWRGAATIRHDQGNRHDPWAIVVEIDGRTVGYLPSSDSNQQLAGDLNGSSRTVPARIMGGFRTPDGSRAYYGVELVL